jgi:uncharacterized membrane protein YkvA (DUF1232 family)
VDFGSWKEKAQNLKREVYSLSLAAKDPRVPWYAKVFAVLIIGCALSPIDLIPDFVPIISYLDDFIIIPAGIVLLIKMIPKEVMEECREKAKSHRGHMKGKHWIAAAFVILIWIIAIYLAIRIVPPFFPDLKKPPEKIAF